MKSSVNRRGIIDRRAARRPGQLSVHSHGWELFSSDTSSYTHAHPIDFINPDSHLLEKRSMLNVDLCSIELTGLPIMFNFSRLGIAVSFTFKKHERHVVFWATQLRSTQKYWQTSDTTFTRNFTSMHDCSAEHLLVVMTWSGAAIRR